MIVLQHIDERRNNKGSAIIAKLSLKHYQCWQGEDFSSHEELNSLIKSHGDKIAVIYPSDNSVVIEEILQADDGVVNKKLEYVIFIDATWRKAKKIWLLSKNLQQLMTLKLETDKKSNYRIRKVPADGYLSTVEAIVDCMSILDQDEAKYQPMLDVFDLMIDFQIKKMGSETYENNYKNDE